MRERGTDLSTLDIAFWLTPRSLEHATYATFSLHSAFIGFSFTETTGNVVTSSACVVVLDDWIKSHLSYHDTYMQGILQRDVASSP
jgi:hypothetical protein